MCFVFVISMFPHISLSSLLSNHFYFTPDGNLRPVLTGEVAKQVEDILCMPQQDYGTNLLHEKTEETFKNASDVLKDFRGKLLKLDIWENFERSFCHFDFELVNGKKVEANVDLFDVKGRVSNNSVDVAFSRF